MGPALRVGRPADLRVAPPGLYRVHVRVARVPAPPFAPVAVVMAEPGTLLVRVVAEQIDVEAALDRPAGRPWQPLPDPADDSSAEATGLESLEGRSGLPAGGEAMDRPDGRDVEDLAAQRAGPEATADVLGRARRQLP